MEDVAVPEAAATVLPPRSWLSAERALRFGGWLIVVALFGFFFDLRLLDITRVFPLLRGDWATYIAGPNFVRDAPWISFPIGRVPGYMAPVGTWLGQVDAMPPLYPFYRALSLAMPHRPFQLIGWELLGSMLATFGIVRAFLRQEARSVGTDAIRAELLATAGAVALLAQPFYLARFGHPTLFQMWVIPWALIVAVRVVDERSADGAGDAAPVTRWAFLAPIAVAAALNPYLALMVLGVLCVTLLAVTRGGAVRETAIRLAASVAIFLVGSASLGYVGTGGRSAATGFGLFSADAALLVDAGGQSRLWPNTRPYGGPSEGFGFPGTAIIVLAAALAMLALVNRCRGRRPVRAGQLWPVWLAAALVLFAALLPVVRVFDEQVLDLNDELAPFRDVTASVRGNGRFVWPFVWLLGLVTVRFLARQPRALAHIALGLAALVQVVDAVPPTVPQAEDRYGPAMAIVREAVSEGVTRIEFQPPNVWTDCPAEEWGPLENIAQLVVAGAVEGLAVNSGYPARGDDRFLHQICEQQRAAYLAGRLEPDVLYVIPPGAEPVTADLRCRPTELSATVCRLPDRPTVSG